VELGWLIAAVALLGAAYTLVAPSLTTRFLSKTAQRSTPAPAVTLIKPLHHEPLGLAQALESFCVQDYRGPVQILFGVADADDPAADVVRTLQARRPDLDIELIVEPRSHGVNRKVSNLINIAGAARHDVLVLSDADIRVPPDYLTVVVAALERPGVGAVTCFYSGEGVAGFWSTLSAMAINYHFLPNAILGKTIGMADPCFGSTIALTRATLRAAGGFESVADKLADDFELGARVRRLGLTIATPPMAVTHDCTDTSLAGLVDHEIRWGRTVRIIDPVGYLGSLITNPLPLAVIAAALLGFSPASLGLIFTILMLRIALKIRIDGATGERAGPWWLLPARDVLSFGVFLASFTGETVDWQGRRFRGERDGALSHT
jgi:ceramide glucosyltransferase